MTVFSAARALGNIPKKTVPSSSVAKYTLGTRSYLLCLPLPPPPPMTTDKNTSQGTHGSIGCLLASEIEY